MDESVPLLLLCYFISFLICASRALSSIAPLAPETISPSRLIPNGNIIVG